MTSRLLRRAALAFLAGCSAPNDRNVRPPSAEFLLGAADSTFWVATTAGEIRVRGAPIILARYDGRFYEVYAHHDDLSYPDAILLGDRIYRRDLLTGDSTLVLADTTVARIAKAYAEAHPNERPLDPEEDGEADPTTNVTAEFDIIDIYGPYLSYEYHLDVELPGKSPWHSTRHGVVDLRLGKERTAVDLFGQSVGARLTSDARRAFAAIRDSIARDLPNLRGDARRAAAALEQLEFDESSFTLTSQDGRLAVTFSVPGRGEGPGGNAIDLDPQVVDSVSWWPDAAPGLPRGDDAGDDRWRRSGYQIVARYDTSGEYVRVALGDTARGREWTLFGTRAPLFQVLWLDDPAVRAEERTALTRAFNHAAAYDEGARVALSRPPNLHLVTRHAPLEDRSRKSARDVRAHDARARKQHGPCLRRRDLVDDGQDGRDRGVSAQPRRGRDGVDRPRRFPRADPPGRPGDHAGECQFCRQKLDGSGRARGG